jgi:hypothetical protein
MFRRGFDSENVAPREERLAKQQFGQVDLAADGTVAAELAKWLEERELDLAVTSLSNYRHAIRAYVIPVLGAPAAVHIGQTRSTTCTGTCWRAADATALPSPRRRCGTSIGR